MNDDEALAPLLRNAIEAFSDPTRGAILLELGRAGELTATQLARHLGLSVNNLYHHMRVLTKLGLLEPPRTVPGKTYVEKYYRVRRELVMGTRDPEWVERVARSLTPQERKVLLISLFLQASQILRQAAQRYERMDAETLDTLFSQRQVGMVSINQMDRERLQFRVDGLRELMAREAMLFPEDAEGDGAPDVVVMATLPFFWDVGAVGDSEEQADG
ncbi:MAG TPA: helix-turn-helix domain-containing protein [Ktedonobacterales bacterium]|jgi:DNA-binding transcriptional ArsR family regulator|nr:helix-turn-helix domain-containing protein [Ktedonobacterales bacterium]